MTDSYLLLDYDHYPVRGKIQRDGRLVKQWQIKKPVDLIHQIIDSTELTGFEKIRIKKTLEIITKVFEPKTIKIIDKGEI